MWTINAKYPIALQMIRSWGYRLVGEIAWVKLSPRKMMVLGNGYYLQHAKETCFVAMKVSFNDKSYNDNEF